MQVCCSTHSVILNVMATQYTCSLNGIYCPHWVVQWSHHCSHLHILVHSPWLPGYIDVAQTVLLILTMAALFPDRPHMHLCVHCSVLYSSRDLEATQVPISKWVDKKAVAHLHSGILLSHFHLKEGTLTFCDSMDGPAEWNKPVRERQEPYDFTYMWNLMNTIN